MMKSLKTSILFLAAALLLSSGCASVPMASAAADAQAKQFRVPMDKASIYVYRNETFGAAVKMPVSLDGRMMGSSASETYFHWLVEPGMHRIVSHTENEPSLNINAVAGKDYYVWQEVKMGMWSAGSALHLVNAQSGRAGVRECKLIAAK